MCFFISLLFLGPRFGLVIYWLGWPARWEVAFDGWLVPLLGFILAPWATLTYVVVAPGGVEGFDVFLVVMAGIVDLLSLVGSGGTYRRRGATPTPAY